jgi:hypothetical protein
MDLPEAIFAFSINLVALLGAGALSAEHTAPCCSAFCWSWASRAWS